jgi:hypothetical protein
MPAWTTQVSVDANTGECIASEDPAREPFSRVLQISARALHTGEAGGVVGQALVAATAPQLDRERILSARAPDCRLWLVEKTRNYQNGMTLSDEF